MDFVIVPVWRRAGFAAACLQGLRDAMLPDTRVLVSVDFDFCDDVLDVVKVFEDSLPGQVAVAVRDVDYPTGSYNVLTAMKEALEHVSSNDLVHVLEEDVLVGRGYFGYHQSAHRLVPNAYSVSACENIFLPDDAQAPDKPHAVYLSGAFQVWGSSYRPHRVESILKRLKPNYFPEMQAAMVAEFGEANTLRTGPLYDGVMANDMAATGAPGVFPFVPRAYHAGFEGVSYGNKALPGTTAEQAHQILRMSGDELKALCTLPGARFRPIDLNANLGEVTAVEAW